MQIKRKVYDQSIRCCLSSLCNLIAYTNDWSFHSDFSYGNVPDFTQIAYMSIITGTPKSPYITTNDGLSARKYSGTKKKLVAEKTLQLDGLVALFLYHQQKI